MPIYWNLLKHPESYHFILRTEIDPVESWECVAAGDLDACFAAMRLLCT